MKISKTIIQNPTQQQKEFFNKIGGNKVCTTPKQYAEQIKAVREAATESEQEVEE